MKPSELLEKLGNWGVIPVITIEDPDAAPHLGQSLIAGGLPCAEITLRTSAAVDVIHYLSHTFPELLVGAGTILTPEQAHQAVAAGARFIVSPGLSPALIDWCLERKLTVIPGVATPTEITLASAKGLRVLKFFPAEAMGGIKFLKAIGEVFKGIKFIPTGGIHAANLGNYLSLPSVHACAGSWLASSRLITAGKFDEITRRVRETAAIVEATRG